ncbi:MGMT family protein [Leucobacter weissii]|uniref:MGMT family protein n=1 Tax=Leucobacter weissii TaxID=1983706 RepID=A0A939MRM8_9MICO|nr:MGMT family protein [Leucobacter weissii]MBO1901744.1 MGMT family protein [Leucobacter weissii]
MPGPEFVDNDFVSAVLDLVRRVPPGRVVTYGDLAWALGTNAPRAVGRVMAYYGHAVPWWRVVPASGGPPRGHERLALPHYLEEGTPLREPRGGGDLADGYRIALSSARLDYDHEIYAEAAP